MSTLYGTLLTNLLALQMRISDEIILDELITINYVRVGAKSLTLVREWTSGLLI